MKIIEKILHWFRGKSSENNNKIISFLIGSGFSVADGLPLVGSINQRMSKINESEIIIFNGFTMFKNEQEDLNEYRDKIERLFLQEFLEFYCVQIGGQDKFHYEDFFDYYSQYLRENYKNDNAVNKFCDSFRSKYNDTYDYIWDNINLVEHFSNSFNQLLGSLLKRQKYHEDVTPLNYYQYDDFINFLKTLIKNWDLKIHTLNHDLLFEQLCKVPPLWEEFSDGYSNCGSPYYSRLNIEKLEDTKINKSYLVRLKYFQDKFNKKISLFKLHGSIDTYHFDISTSIFDLTRIKHEYGVDTRFLKEVESDNGIEYVKGFNNAYPDFLSGTTEKMRSYDNEYYSIIFRHFEQNLLNSNTLIVIGYGFGDEGINKILNAKFLNAGKKMIVINPSKPKSPLLDSDDVMLIQKRFNEVKQPDYKEILEML